VLVDYETEEEAKAQQRAVEPLMVMLRTAKPITLTSLESGIFGRKREGLGETEPRL
jgi:hypothetical protein